MRHTSAPSAGAGFPEAGDGCWPGRTTAASRPFADHPGPPRRHRLTTPPDPNEVTDERAATRALGPRGQGARGALRHRRGAGYQARKPSPEIRLDPADTPGHRSRGRRARARSCGGGGREASPGPEGAKAVAPLGLPSCHWTTTTKRRHQCPRRPATAPPPRLRLRPPLRPTTRAMNRATRRPTAVRRQLAAAVPTARAPMGRRSSPRTPTTRAPRAPTARATAGRTGRSRRGRPTRADRTSSRADRRPRAAGTIRPGPGFGSRHEPGPGAIRRGRG